MNYDCVPEVLKQQPNWIAWGVPGEILKVPFDPVSLLMFKTNPAKSGVPDTWGSFESAEQCVLMGLAKGIGYEFDGRGIYGVDLDHVIENGVVTPQAREIVEGLASYTEVSPSGNGLHIFVTADSVNITRHRKQGGFIEIYTNARYFTVTGNVYGDFNHIADRPAELQQIHDRYLLPEAKVVDNGKCIVDSEGVANATNLKSVRTSEHNNYSLYTINYALKKDPVLRACWNGERRCGDESASDQALMNKLAYWCNANHSAMIAAFMQSPYYAGKGEAHKKKCSRADYLPNTAKTACAALRSTAHEDTVRYKKLKEKVR